MAAAAAVEMNSVAAADGDAETAYVPGAAFVHYRLHNPCDKTLNYRHGPFRVPFPGLTSCVLLHLGTDFDGAGVASVLVVLAAAGPSHVLLLLLHGLPQQILDAVAAPQ